MRILILYFSNTGNTEKVAKAIKEGLSGQEVESISVNNANQDVFQEIDLLILGSGVYASRANNSLIKFVSSSPKLPAKIALFCTHESLEFYQTPFKKLEKVIEKQGCEIIGEFDCIGENLGMSIGERMKMINSLPPEKREEAKKSLGHSKGRPNKEDLDNAKKFAAKLISKI